MYIISKKGIVLLPTWWDAGGDGGGGQLSLSFGGHSRHFYGVGGESSESRDPVLPGDVGQVVGDSGVRSVEFLPRNAITCRAAETG